MVDKETIERLALKHMGRYSGYLSAAKRGSQNVREDECKAYLAIWKSIKKKGEWDKLNSIEQGELRDAVYDEKDERGLL